MKKLTALFLCCVGLVGCGSSQPHLLHNHQPILNIEASLATQIDAEANRSQAWIKNKLNKPLSLWQHLYWYDKNGVTQGERQSRLQHLAPQQKVVVELQPATPQSVNYRLYLTAK